MSRPLLLELLGVPRLADADLRVQAAQADWRQLLELAGPALHPMIASRLAERRVDAPAWASDQLRQSRRASAATMARRRSEVRRALEALEHAGVDVMVLKGFTLAHLVYPSPETRMMGDVDLWVHAASLHPAVTALQPLGWRVPWWRDTAAAPVGSGGQVGLLLPSASLLIELHREPGSLAETIPDELATFWSRRQRVDLGGIPAWTLPPDEMLIHLSLHLAEHHRFLDAVGRLLDVTLVLKAFGPGIDWPAFADRCASLGISGWVATSLGSAAAMFGAPIPDDALAAFHVPDLDHLCAVASVQAWLRPGRGEAPQSVLSAPTPIATGQRLGRRAVELFEGTRAGPGVPGLSPRQMFRRLRVTAQLLLPSFMRTLWRTLARPAESARLRRLSADNEALVGAMRARSGRQRTS